MKHIEIYTDGSCSGNPGPGGWAAVCPIDGKKKYVAGFEKHSTAPRMELTAVIGALKALHGKGYKVTFYLDSTYVINCASHSDSWLSDEERVNRDLWLEYITQKNAGKYQVEFVKVKGHGDVELNNLADKLAKQQVRKIKHEMYGGK